MCAKFNLYTMRYLEKALFLVLITQARSLPTRPASTLQQVQVVFRHGDRTPDAVSMYPKDPHINDTWYPDGLGALTTLGKVQEFNIGRELRRTYNEFLGKIYTPEVLDAWSTDYNRTKMSLELALAGLWPPALSQKWNPILDWQPIPYNYLPSTLDKLLSFPLFYCPNYKVVYEAASQSPEFLDFLSSNAQAIEYINENSGLNCKTTLDLFILYFGLYAEEKTGRKLPVWTKKIYPEFLESATVLEYRLQTYNNALLRGSGGRLVKKVIDDARAKMNGVLVPKGRKIFLYSGHEINIAHTLATLNLFKPHVPKYASYIVFEFHKINNVYGFKILYQDYSQLAPRLLTMPGCQSFCPFDKFVELTQDVVANPDSC